LEINKVSLSREEKEKFVLEFYYTKGYTYKQITKELRMSPNQIRAIIKKHEEKSNAIANKKKQLSLSSKAYKLYSKGKTNVEVAMKLDIPQVQATLFHFEYCRLMGLDDFEFLYVRTRGKVTPLCKLYEELVIKRGMSIEQVANSVDIALNRLPYMECLYEIAKREADRMQEKRDYLSKDIIFLRKDLELEEEKQRRKLTLSFNHYPNYGDSENSAMGASSLYSDHRKPSPLPYWQSELPDLSNEFRNEQGESKRKEEIHGVDEDVDEGVDEGDIAD
jgi:transposase-like protein